MRYIYVLVLLIYASTSIQNVWAGHENKSKLLRAYGGASVIYTNYDLPNDSDLGVGLKGFAGVDIGRFFSIETAFLHNGESVSGGDYTLSPDSHINMNLLELSALARIPTIRNLYIFGKVGRLAWRATLEECSTCKERGRSQENHTGFGLEYQFTQGGHMLVEYSNASLQLFETTMDLSVISLSVKLSMR